MQDLLMYSGMTHQGLVRERNEDSFVVVQPDGNSLPLCVVLADGMGGHQNGVLASKTAVSYCQERIKTDVHPNLFPDELDRVLTDMIQKANIRVYLKSLETDENSGMGTTLTIAVFSETELVLGHIGDCRCYLLRDGELDIISMDHTLVEEMVQSGTITREESMSHPQRHILSQALGTPEYLNPDLVHLPLRPRDRFLNCSDGLHGFVPDTILQHILQSTETPDEASEQLIDAALAAGGPDNISVITVFYAR